MSGLPRPRPRPRPIFSPLEKEEDDLLGGGAEVLVVSAAEDVELAGAEVEVETSPMDVEDDTAEDVVGYRASLRRSRWIRYVKIPRRRQRAGLGVREVVDLEEEESPVHQVLRRDAVPGKLLVGAFAYVTINQLGNLTVEEARNEWCNQ